MPRRVRRPDRKGEKKVGALRIPPRATSKNFYEAQAQRITEAVEKAQEKPGTLLLPHLPFERKLQQRTQDKLRRQRAFLEQVREGATMSDALRAVGVSHRAVKTWCTQDAYFAHVYGYAREERTDLVEKALRHAAITGPKYIVASGGKLIGYNQVPDVRAQVALLKAERPEQFGDKRQIELSGSVQFSKPEVTVILAQVRQVLRGGIDIPALPAAEVIDAVVVDDAASDSTSDEEFQ